jgi:predicted dehydrogenase
MIDRTTIRVGLIGFGMSGRVFHAPLVSSIDGLSLAAVLERTSGAAAARYPGIATYRTLDDLLADDSLSLIVVATPNATHFEIAQRAIDAGKHVVVDKPVAPRSDAIAGLISLARKRNVLLIPFHNRRWDGDFLTVQKLLAEGALGRLVHYTSRFDRWRPKNPPGREWTEDPEQGGVLFNLGPHLADQALQLFGLPLAVGAEVLRERDQPGANDSFTVRLRYPGLIATLASNYLSLPAGPRFHLRGARGNYWKQGLDPQEAALNNVLRIPEGHWGEEPRNDWGLLCVDVAGGTITRPVETLPGDYRRFYAAVRDAIAGNADPPVSPLDAWRVARIFEWPSRARRSAAKSPATGPLSLRPAYLLA